MEERKKGKRKRELSITIYRGEVKDKMRWRGALA